jgi:hypothetical protein
VWQLACSGCSPPHHVVHQEVHAGARGVPAAVQAAEAVGGLVTGRETGGCEWQLGRLQRPSMPR